MNSEYEVRMLNIDTDKFIEQIEKHQNSQH